MYQLYYNKKEMVLRIEPLRVLQVKPITDEVSKFNDCYYVCNNRKELKKFAMELKQKWLNELEIQLEKVNNLKIQNKYK